MAQNKIVTDIEFNISKALKSIQTLRSSLSGKVDIIGVDAVQRAESGLQQIEQQIVKLQQKAPGVGATAQEFDKFYKETLKVTNGMDKLLGEFQGFQVTDDYLKENISTLQELSKQAADASKKTKELKENIASTAISSYETKGQKQKSQQAERQMREYALQGKSEKIKETYAERGAEYKTLIAEAKTSGDDERVKSLIRDRNQLIAIEQKYLALARQVTAVTEQEKIEAANLRTALDNAFDPAIEEMGQFSSELNQVSSSLHQVQNSSYQANQEMLQVEKSTKAFGQLSDQITYLFSATSVFYALRRVVRGAIQDFQELDKQFNEIAIVSDYSTSEMWESFSTVNKTAQEFGVTTKNVLEVQNLYYHQGKDMAEVNKLTAQTLTLAKITGMDYEQATSDLTAALNAYNIAAEDAVRVTDTIAAMDTNAAISSEELMTALTKTASIAANAGMSLESTEVFLTKMIETTREAPENLGTALKTIIARFGEVKEVIDGEEVELADINRVDTALKTIGISLLDTAGQIRDLDGVFMELSSKWDDLDRNTQRYIATIAAGSRQQSRFIAMMEDYDRTLELTEIAQNSAGLGAKQLAKAQESIETSVNRLKSSWQEFYQNIIKSGAIKTVLDTANTFLSVLNALPGPLGVVTAGVALWALKTKVLDKALLTHKIINDGLVKGLTQEQITQNILTALTQKRSSALKEYLAVLKLYQIEQTKSAVAEAVQAKAIDENTQEQINNALAIAAREKIEDMSEADDALSVLNLAAENEALDENTRQLLKNTAARLSNNIAKSNGSKKGITSTLSGVFGKSGKLGQLLTKAGGFLVKAGPWIAGIAAAIIALTVVYKKFIKASVDDTKQVEKLEKARENYNNSLNEYNELLKNAEIVEEHRHKKFKSAEDLEEEQEAIKALVEEYPNLLEYIDDEGNYHIKNAEAIEREIQAKKELTEQSLKTYSALRVQYAKQGIYTDKSTLAGQSMANLKEYYSVFDEDTIDVLAETIDSTGTLFSGYFKEFAEAYASGEKTSFGYKDFSNLFAGSVTKEGFETLAEAYGQSLEEGSSISSAIEEALKATGEYTENQINDIITVWTVLNEQTGDLYSNLLSGIGKEVNEIYVQEAELFVDEALGDTETSEQVKNALSQAYARTKGEKVSDYEGISSPNTGYVWEDKFKQYRLKGFSEEEAINQVLEEGWGLSSIEELYALEGLEYSEGMKPSWVQGGYALLTDQQREELAMRETKEYITSLTEELKDSDNIKKVNQAFENFGSAIFGTTWDGLGINLENETLITFLEEEYDYQLQEIQAIADKVNSSIGEYNQVDEYSFDTIKDLELTHDQIRRVEEIYEQLGDQGGNRFLEGFYSTVNDSSFGQLDSEKQQELKNLYLNTDVTDIKSITETIHKLGKVGLDTSDSLQKMVDAAGGLDAFTFADVQTEAEELQKEIETLTESLEGLADLARGEGTLTDVGSLINSIALGAKDNEDLQAKLTSLINNAQITTEGIKIGDKSPEESAKEIVELQQESIMYQMRINKGKMIALETDIKDLEAQGILTEAQAVQLAQLKEELGLLQQEDALLRVSYGEAGASYERLIRDERIEGLEKELETLEKLRDALKDYVSWLREYDRYANLDEAISTLEEDFEHLDFEIDFSTNTDVIQKDLEKQLTNINTQIAANQGGILAAEEEQAMWRDVIGKRNSQYVTFDANGNAIVKASELQKLQEEIKDADEEHREAIQAEYDEIMDNVDAYNKAKDKVEDYSTALEENFNELKEFFDGIYESVTKIEDKLIEVRQAAEDKELEAVKEKYEAIKEENDKYLENVQDMIDEERRIRDRADQEQDVKDKEKKLAMMKMDTSGVYTSDIRALEKELESDYRSLEDDAIDQAINELSKSFDAQAEALDKEVEYLENVLEYKREKMTEYNEWANEMLMQGSDTVIAYLKANDEEYYTGTAAAQALWVSEWEQAVAQGISANELMGTSLAISVQENLILCTQNANGFEGAVQQYSETAIANNGKIASSVETLTTYYQNLAGGVEGVITQIGYLQGAYDDAADAAAKLAAAEQQTVIGQAYIGEVTELTDNPITGGSEEPRTHIGSFEIKVPTKTSETYSSGHGWTDGGKYGQTLQEIVADEQGNFYANLDNRYVKLDEDNVEFGNGQVLTPELALSLSRDPDLYQTYLNKKYRVKETAVQYKFAKGGYVDYTGPAWVDGTKSHPEYMLNATQTRQFETLIAALDSMFSSSGISTISQSSQKTGDATYNFHINVDQLANDYDVDKLVSRIEEKMVKASQYRNITVLKKSQ